ncbi:MAG: cysteine peptidase family C39 domain-containing protein [Patescibacteria group bacterium]|nr:cysteine peptidase family C39 domain-containing protein [Patescibacteria group bacterium]
MTYRIKKFLLIISIPVFIMLIYISFPSRKDIFAQTPTSQPANSQSLQDLENQIHDLENKISDLQGQEKTLSDQISYYDTQMKVTTLRIAETKTQIDDLENNIEITSTKIATLEGSLNQVGNVLLERILATYKVGSVQPLQLLMSSKSLSDFVMKESYLRIVQDHDKELMIQVQMTKVNFTEQKQILEDKQAKLKALQVQLESYTKQLADEETSKKRLLAETQGSEENYQRLLSAAKAQLAGFSNFVANQGGASILSGQTSCDSWGCYYNQRDSQWGNIALNHTQYTIASDGCLVTSMAMVITHYGHKVTPLDINNNPSNFASYYPAYLLYTISVNGVTASRIGAQIDSILSSNNPVIVGIYAYGGTHFVVLTSGSNGNYKMNDPFIENGHNISFSDHYSVGSIFEIDKVVVS